MGITDSLVGMVDAHKHRSSEGVICETKIPVGDLRLKMGGGEDL